MLSMYRVGLDHSGGTPGLFFFFFKENSSLFLFLFGYGFGLSRWLSHSVGSTFCDPMGCSIPGFPAYHQLPELAHTHVHQVDDAIQPSHPLFFHPLLLMPSIFPSIRVFSNESVLHIRWLKYWSFSISISPSNE